MSQRLTRQDIKRDEVLESLGAAVEFIRRNARALVLGVVVLVALVVAAFGYRAYREGRETRAGELLAEAALVLEAPVTPEVPRPDDPDSPSFASEAARRERARELFSEVRGGFSGTRPAAVAAAYLGELAAQAGDLTAARASWEEFLERAGDHMLATQVRLNLMALDRAEGRGEELAERLEGMLDQPEPPLPRDVMLFELARTLDGLGRSDAAAESWRRLVEEHPQSPYAITARSRVPAPVSGPVAAPVPGLAGG